MNRRVVITGVGVVTPIGVGWDAFTESLKEGWSGEGDIHSFEFPDFPVKRAFEVKDFDAKRHGTHLLDPFIQYAVAAADEAFEHAKFIPEAVDVDRTGISMSSSKGGVRTIDRFRERFRQNRSAILGARIYTSAVPNFAAQWIARKWKVRGPAKCYIAACATGTAAILEGMRMVRDDIVDYCVAGASDASIVPLMLAGYKNMKALSLKGMRPFDRRRSGFMVGEGAGAVFLETYESAKARGADILAEVVGGAFGNDCFHVTRFDPDDDALARTVKNLMQKTELSPEMIDYVNLHGTATVEGDIYETNQLKTALGARANDISMSSTKSMTGHMLGASGAVEVASILSAMKHGFIPPTIGLEEPDPRCDLDYTPLRAKDKKVVHALSVSMGFGGHITAIALKNLSDGN